VAETRVCELLAQGCRVRKSVGVVPAATLDFEANVRVSTFIIVIITIVVVITMINLSSYS